MSCNTLKVSIIPHDIVWGDKAENLLTIEEFISKLERDTDVVILPEMFTTGFVLDSSLVSNLAETNSDKTINTIHRLAKQYNLAICGSFMASTASEYFNRAFFIEPSGEEHFYDKKHLFSIGGENRIYKKGNQKSPIIRYRGWNISLIVCYDLRFPVWCRNVNNQYDILIVVANWPKSRSFAWKQLLISRAIENQAYVIGANRSGQDDLGVYQIEDSIVVDFKGNTIQNEVNNCIINAELLHDNLKLFRTKFAAWQDADKFQIL